MISQGEGNWPQNFNKVLKKATGDFIKYLHEDDMLTSNCINDSVEALLLQNVDFIHGNAIEIDQISGNQVSWVPIIKEPTFYEMIKKNFIHSATLMYRREIFEKIGSFDESAKMLSFEEYEFNLRCLSNGFTLGYCDSFLAYYRRHNRQIIRSVDKRKRTENRNDIVKKYWDALQNGTTCIGYGH